MANLTMSAIIGVEKKSMPIRLLQRGKRQYGHKSK
jgi:hypothetical protein